MDPQQLKGPFLATVQATIAGLGELQQILRNEQDALVGNQPEALEQIVRRKADSLQQLEHGVKAREHILQQAGLPGGLVGAEQFFSAHFTPAERMQDWESLLNLSREVSDLNIHNGKLARAGERTTREALGILTGRPQSSGTYSRKGAESNGLSGYSFGKC